MWPEIDLFLLPTSLGVLSGSLSVRTSRNLLDRWLDYERASFSFSTLMIAVGRKYTSAVDLLPAPSEEGLPAFCCSARKGLGALEARSCGKSARFALLSSSETIRNLLTFQVA